jgi:hypothetical protein
MVNECYEVFFLAVSHVNAELRTNIPETGRVPIIMVNVRNDQSSFIYVSVTLLMLHSDWLTV